MSIAGGSLFVGLPGEPLVARVLPDVSGLDKSFDYLVPDSMAPIVRVGTMVRVELHGRRVGGWVTRLGPPSADTPLDGLRRLAKVSGTGPSPELVDLAAWAAARWGSVRVANVLTAASPPTMVPATSNAAIGATLRPAQLASGGVHRLGPLTDPLPTVVDALVAGRGIVIHPSNAGARALAGRLRRRGLKVALMPDDWSQAASGVDVVVGSRSAVWAPCPDLAVIVVLDEHDDALQEERAPTWHARDVAIERAARASARCVLVSPCPTVTAVRWAAEHQMPVTSVGLGEQRAGWPIVEIVDRSDVEPWKRSLISSELIRHLRSDARVLCVVNTTGRARLLACRKCRALQRCERCDAAVSLDDDGALTCGRCATVRPQICQSCSSGAMANVKPGVTRLREELEAAAGRPVGAVAASLGSEVPTGCDVFVGTEAALHRLRNIDVVAFLDIDAELLAPRYKAAEHTLALMVRAARLVGGRRDGSRLLVQTNLADHELLRALQLADTAPLVESELARRRLLSLPPFGALAAVMGGGARSFASAAGFAPAGGDDDVLVRAPSWELLGPALAATPRPRGSRLRVEVDPPRR